MGLVSDAFDVLSVVESTTSRSEKERLITEAKGNSVMAQMLLRAYNAENFYITPEDIIKDAMKKASAKLPNDKQATTNYEAFNDLLDRLAARKITGNAARDRVEEFFAELSAPEVKWYGRVLLRHMDIGVQAKTLLKIWPPKNVAVLGGKPVYKGCFLAQVFDPMKAEFPQAGDPKFDGLRFTYVSDAGTCSGFTRGNHTYATVQHVEKWLAKIGGGVYDAEMMGKLWNDSSSLVKRTKPTAADIEKAAKEAFAWIFDYVPLDDYYSKGGTNMPLVKRRRILVKRLATYLVKHPKLLAEEIAQSAVTAALEGLKKRKTRRASVKVLIEAINGAKWPLRVVPWTILHNQKEVGVFYQKCLKEGFEGIMVKTFKGGWWANKRGREWGKIKPETDVTMEILDTLEGKGKLRGKLGSFVCKYKGERVRVGGKMSDMLRQQLWVKRKSLVGRKIDVLVQDRPTADCVVSFPRFKRFRDDL